MDSICHVGYKSKTSVTQTDRFDWWEPIYLDGLSAVSKFIFPQVPSSISGYGVAGPRLSATTVISYFKTRHSHNISNYVQFTSVYSSWTPIGSVSKKNITLVQFFFFFFRVETQNLLSSCICNHNKTTRMKEN